MTAFPGRMRDHWWWRPGVWPGRRLLVWHILADDAPQVRALARACHELLRPVPGLDLVPLDWLHMTTLIVGPQDEIAPQAQDAMIDSARAGLSDLAPITVTLGEPRTHAEGVTIGPRPSDALLPIWERLRALTVATVPGCDPPDSWWPHMSVAYSNADIAAAPVAEALRPAPPPVEWTVRKVYLVSQERVGHLYRWEHLAAVSLA